MYYRLRRLTQHTSCHPERQLTKRVQQLYDNEKEDKENLLEKAEFVALTLGSLDLGKQFKLLQCDGTLY